MLLGASHPAIAVVIIVLFFAWRPIKFALRWFFEGLFLAEGAKAAGLFRRARPPRAMRRRRPPRGYFPWQGPGPDDEIPF
jgi:hypothetical protein